MPNRTRPAHLIAPLILLLACTASRADSGVPGTRTRHDILTVEQLRSTGTQNAFDAVQALRASWLRPRGPDSFRTPGQVMVYIDDVRLGGVDTLRNISVPQIIFIQYYDGNAASGRWGLDHGNGVIFVSTREQH